MIAGPVPGNLARADAQCHFFAPLSGTEKSLIHRTAK
jgi:hypothetical protein